MIEETKIKTFSLSKVNWKHILVIFLFIVGMILLRVFAQFSFRITIVWEMQISLNFAALLVYYVGIMFKPAEAFSIVSIGALIGDGIYCLVYGCGGELPIYLAISLFSYGGMVLLISLLRKKNIFLAYLVGTAWYYFGVMFPSGIYYFGIYDSEGLMVFAGSLLLTIFHLGFIPVALLLIYLTRRFLEGKSANNSLE